VCPIEHGGCERLDGSLPLFCVVAQFLWKRRLRIKQRESNGPARFGKVAGGDETVATVAAGAT
jgi:hypothetical protein